MTRASGQRKLKQSTYEVWRSLGAAVQAAYKLAPFVVVVSALVIGGVTWLTMWSTTTMVATVLLLVLIVAIAVYASTEQYGEAALALVGGLLTAYSVSWTPHRFVGFIAIWSAFSFFALLYASIKIAARSESIFRQAALAFAAELDQTEEVEARLRSIAESGAHHGLGPIERAEAIRVFVYRKLPIEVMHPALKAVAMLSVITQIESNIVAQFVADVYKIFHAAAAEHGDIVLDVAYQTIRESAASPADFMAAFGHSRRLVLSQSLDATQYFAQLQTALEAGVPPEGVTEYLEEHLP